MKRLNIYNTNNTLIAYRDFDNDQELNEYISFIHINESWGKPEQQSLISPEEKIYDEEGNLVETIEAVYETVPSEFTYEIEDITSELEEQKRKQDLIEAGKKARQVCASCLDLIAGYNLSQNLSAAQITQMQSSFGSIQSALLTSRPSTAKALISALSPDGVLVTEELKSLVLNELKDY